MTPLQELVDLAAPVGPCAANIADLEIRLQATVGGNLCAGDGRGAARRPAGRAARGRRAGAIRQRRRDDDRAARGLPRRPRRQARPRRELRGAGGGRLRRARPPAHARVHGARRLGGAARRRDDQARGHGRRLVGRQAAVCRSRCTRTPRLRVPPRSRTSTSTTTRSRPPGTGSRPSRCSSGGRSPNSEESR